jgi:hypothetical protein
MAGSGGLNVERRQSASATRVAGVAELSRQQGGVASRKARPEAAQAVLGAERQRLQHLLAVSPAIIYSTKASGDFACTFVSENIRTIMGFAREDMLADPETAGCVMILTVSEAKIVYRTVCFVVGRGHFRRLSAHFGRGS